MSTSLGHAVVYSDTPQPRYAPLVKQQHVLTPPLPPFAHPWSRRWDRAHELMIEHGQPPRHLIPRMVREIKMKPRLGTLKLLARLAALSPSSFHAPSLPVHPLAHPCDSPSLRLLTRLRARNLDGAAPGCPQAGCPSCRTHPLLLPRPPYISARISPPPHLPLRPLW